MTDTHTILRDADRCVKCGLCLPHCPTYGRTGDENESPRGRIALMQALAQGALGPQPRLIGHLDHCLACRACEAVCPSAVAYGRLLDATRAVLEHRRPPRRLAQRLLRGLGFTLIRWRGARRGATHVLRLYQRAGLHAWFERHDALRRWFPVLSRLNRVLPTVPAPHRWQHYYPPKVEVRGIVALFLGCVGEAVDTPTLQASVRMLNRLGYGVVIPHRQGCCGALHLHNGEPDGALALARHNVRALLDEDIQAVVYTATGCGAQLAEYAGLPWANATERAQAARLAARAREICAFIDQQPWPQAVQVAPLAHQVAVHTPCSQRYLLHDATATERLLARIPDLQITPLAGNRHCCGAAGSYMLSEPDIADALRADKLKAIAASATTLLVTTNIGCALHLAAGLRQTGSAVEIVHPVVLLDRQCRAAQTARNAPKGSE